MDDFLAELRRTFLLEGQELLEQIERHLVQLRPESASDEVLEALFRDFHTLKGNSRSVGYNEIADLTHKIENILTEIKLGELSFTESVIDCLLASKDAIQSDLETLANGFGTLQDHGDLILRLDRAVMPDKELQAANQSADPEGVSMEDGKPNCEEFVEVSIDKSDIQSSDESIKFSAGFEIFEDEQAPSTEVIAEDISDDHILESDLSPLTEKSTKAVLQDEYLRVPLSKVNELVILSREQAGLLSILEYMTAQGHNSVEDMLHQINQLVDRTYQLQKVAISLRMVTLDTIEAKLQRVIHDTCKLTDKQVRLEVGGACSEIEKGVLDPLVHMVRNSIDHGIEAVEDRKRLGKNECGVIRIQTYAKGGFVFLELSDDGRGLDRSIILEKARTMGVIKDSGDHLADWQIYHLIFESGFSTKSVVTEVSGRGVGMDVVRSEVSRLNGKIDIRSEQGKGTTFVIRLPLPIATFNGVLVRVGNYRYILPNSEIEAIHAVQHGDIVRVDSKRQIVDLGRESLTLLRLFDENGREIEAEEKLCILQVSLHGKKFGLVVDEVQESRKYTYKKLGSELDDLPGVSGGAVLGDGQVCLILNATDLVETAFQMAA